MGTMPDELAALRLTVRNVEDILPASRALGGGNQGAVERLGKGDAGASAFFANLQGAVIGDPVDLMLHERASRQWVEIVRDLGTTWKGIRQAVGVNLAPQLEDIHERMSGVVIENLSWRKFIERYDRPSMLFYLDPPYWGNEDDYGKEVFGREDSAELAYVLSRVKGHFILSLNAVQGVFETFSKFNFEEVVCTYSVCGNGSSKRVKEVIISS